jgi:hypothetical protein
MLDNLSNNNFKIGDYISFINVENIIGTYDSIIYKYWNGSS